MDREEDYKKREVGEVKTQIYPNFPYLRERAIYKRLRVTRQNAKEASMPKRVPITFKTNSRALFANMWIQTQVDLWLFDDAVGRKPFHAFQLSNDKI